MVKLWIKFQEEDPISNCSDKPQRSAGDIPECAFFASKLERLEKKGVMIGKFITSRYNFMSVSKLCTEFQNFSVSKSL